MANVEIIRPDKGHSWGNLKIVEVALNEDIVPLPQDLLPHFAY